MVSPTVVASVNRLSCLPGEQPRSSEGCVQSCVNPPTISHTQTGCLQSIRQRFSTAGLSNTAVELLSNSVKASTSKSYSCSWSTWSSWCAELQSNPILCPVEDVLTFLADQFSEGKEYRTVNVFRSAISSAHANIDNKPVGQHPLVCRLMKGISISRPPQPRYQLTWDVQTVTNYLSGLGENSKLSLKQLSQKLCMLMALTCPDHGHIRYQIYASLSRGR
jgi:hypothetical protein